MDNPTEFEPPKKSTLSTVKVPLIVILPLVLVAIIVWIFRFKMVEVTQCLYKRPSNNNVTISVPKQNNMVYTRCVGKENNADYCYLYLAEIGKSLTEQKIFTINFPAYQGTKGSRNLAKVDLYGVADNKIVFDRIFDVDIDNSKKQITSYFDLKAGKEVVVSTNDQVTYLDNINAKLFMSIVRPFAQDPNDPKNPGKIIEYDLTNNQSKTIETGNEDLGVIYANKENAYLQKIVLGPGTSFGWEKTLSLTTGEIIEKPKSINPNLGESEAVLSAKGKVAYTIVNKSNKGLSYNLSLFVSDVDGSNQKVLYTFSSKQSSEGPEGNIGNLLFSPDGNYLLAKIETSGNDSSSDPWVGIWNMNSIPKYNKLALPFYTIHQNSYKWVTVKDVYYGSSYETVLFREENLSNKDWYLPHQTVDSAWLESKDGSIDFTKDLNTIVIGADDMIIAQ